MLSFSNRKYQRISLEWRQVKQEPKDVLLVGYGSKSHLNHLDVLISFIQDSNLKKNTFFFFPKLTSDAK